MPEAAKRIYRNLVVLFSASFAFLAGTLILILQSKGLDLPQLGLYLSVYSIAVFLLEVPTGAFADVHGRKNAILMAFLAQMVFLSGFLIFEGPIFVAFAVVAAFADSFFSGSAEAHAVDVLNERKRSRHLHQLLASGKSYMFGTFLVGSAVGGLLALESPTYPVILCLGCAAIGFGYCLFRLEETERHKSFVKAEKDIIRKMKEAYSRSMENPQVRMIYLVSFLFGIGTAGLFMFWQPAFVELNGWDMSNAGLYFSLISICAILGARVSGRVKANRLAYGMSLLMLFALLFLAGMAFLPLWAALIVLAWESVLGFVQPIESTILNRNTDSDIRATAISIKALAYRLSFGGVGLGLFLLQDFEVDMVWMVTAAAFLAAALLVFRTRGFR